MIYQGSYSGGQGWDLLYSCGHRAAGGTLFSESLERVITGSDPWGECSKCADGDPPDVGPPD
ncbi:MAG: hypothetical protein GY926_04780 [bacterium]|nr:hypothetical protein [bacterium]